MADCSKCVHCIKHDIDDYEQWCEKGMFEEHPYQPIIDCEYFEERKSLSSSKRK